MTKEQRLILTIAVLASLVVFLDQTIVNVALPAISAELGGGLAAQQWIVDAYLLTLGSFILVAGSLSDVLGRVTILRVGLIGFGVMSVVIAAAPNTEVLIAARAVQGAAGALVVPSSLALITSTFRGPSQARAIGIWTGATSIALLAGPLIGGILIDTLSWRWAFLINVIPVGITVWLLARVGHKNERKKDVPIDYLGAVLCVLGLGGPVFALIEAPRLGWSNPAIYLPMILGILAFAGFIVRERFARAPLMPLGLFRIRNFWSGNVATAFIYGALALAPLTITIYLQQVAGLPATLAGLATVPITLIMVLLSSRIGGLAGRWGPRLFMTVGPLVMAGGALLMLMVSPDFSYWTQLLPGVLVFGLGLTITVAPLTAAILGSIEAARSGIASAVNNAVARVAGLIAVAMLGLIVGGTLDLNGLHRVLIVTAGLMLAGAVISFVGIRNPRREPDDALATTTAGSDPAAG